MLELKKYSRPAAIIIQTIASSTSTIDEMYICIKGENQIYR